MATNSTRADAILGVRVDLDPPRSTLTIVVLSMLAGLLKLGRWTNLVRGDQSFVVVVYMRHSGQHVAEYRHRTRRHAKAQMNSLERRLRTQTIEELAAHLGVPRDSLVSDGGTTGA